MLEAAQEKRRFPRVSLSNPVRFQIRGSCQFHTSVSDDLSVGGLSFTSDCFIPSDTPVMLEIELLSRILRPIGKIVWAKDMPHSDRRRFGVEFIEFGLEERKMLEDFILLKTGSG